MTLQTEILPTETSDFQKKKFSSHLIQCFLLLDDTVLMLRVS